MASTHRSHAQGFTASMAALMTLLVTASLLCFHTATAAAPATASAPSGIVDTPIGTVNAIAVTESGTTYVGGGFTSVGANTGSGALVSASDGAVNRSFPSISNGAVAVVVSDGAGGYYIGGSFTAIDGVPRNRAARILANGNLDPRWNPNLNGSLSAITVSGDTVYLAGAFSGANSVNGTLTRNRAAAVDATTGIATAWDPNLNDTVNTMAISGDTVYLGGYFAGANSVNGTLTRNRAAAVDTTTGVATAWDPNLNNIVNDLALIGSTVYLGGAFNGANSVNGYLTRNRAAAVDATTGTATAWDPNISGSVWALETSGSTVYLTGSFNGANSVNGNLTRNNAAAVNATTGTATAWDPNISGSVSALGISGSTVYLAGNFNGANSVNGNLTRNRAAAVDITTGTATDWDPNLSSGVATLAVSGGTVYLGANSVNGTQTRNRAAAVNATTGTARSWDPNLNGTVNTIAISDTTVYLGGAFNGANSVNGTQTRNRAAAVNATTGTATAWDPNLNNNLSTMAISGTTIYLGGDFTSVNSTLTRSRAAAVDTTTGTATTWNPNISGVLYTVAVSGGSVYLGGNFLSTSGSLQSTARTYLARVAPMGANPPQPTSANVSGVTLTWPVPLYGGMAQYYVMYRQQGATYPWAIYATGLNNNNPGIALDNPGTRNACSANNTAMGYTSCPMVRGWTPGITYELAVVTRTTEGKNSLNPIKTLTTYTVPAR